MENGKSYKVLVSGAGGFVGSAVCSEFIADSAEVTAIGRTPPKDGRVGFIKWIPQTQIRRSSTATT